MSIMKNINYIQELDRIPCAQPDMMLIVKTAFEAAPPALLTLFSPGCTDIVKTRLGHSPFHSRKISSLLKGIKTPQIVAANKFLYQIGYFAAEKYLWWWMVADVTTEFVTTWQSLVFEEQQCELPGAGTAYGYMAPSVYAPDDTGGLVVSPTQLRPGVQVGLNSIIILPGFQATMAYSVVWDSWPERGKPCDVDTYMIENDDGVHQDPLQTNQQPGTQANTSAWHRYHSKPGFVTSTKYSFYVHNNSEYHVQPIKTSWNVGLFGHKAGNTTFGCKLKPVSWPFPSFL